jgi:DNA-binding NtrC family response regulator
VNRSTSEPLIIGESEPIRELRALISKVAPTRLPVLIHGPTGAGKELVAARLHAESGRAGALVPVNICALPPTLFESELFGHVKGAFSGAHCARAGLLSRADRGTLFLDEIGGMDLNQQVKMLRALETRAFLPLGGTKELRSDFRLVSATNECLETNTVRGAFRADLLHRIGGVIIRVPSLSSRPGDIHLLLRHFGQCNPVVGSVTFTDAAICAMREYSWPGNVRQLKAFAERAATLASNGVVDEGEVLPALNRGVRQAAGVDSNERLAIVEALQANSWNIRSAALCLGMHQSTLYRRLKEHAITLPCRKKLPKFDSTALELGNARA